MKRTFEVKEKTLFLVSQVLSFRHTKQTSKNVEDTTFKHFSSPYLSLENSPDSPDCICSYIGLKFLPRYF